MIDILVLCDDLWHPAEVIEKGFSLLNGGKYHFEFVMAAKDILTLELLRHYSLIISCKGNNVIAANDAPWFEEGVTEAGPKEFRSYVEAGGGFIAIHAANAFTKEDCPAYCDFIGNSFVTHPPRCMVRVSVTDQAHPVTAGVEDFSVRDEHYEITDIASDASIFLKSTSEQGGIQIAGYTRNMGEGKLCVLTPGHTLSVWENKGFQRLMHNAIEWCRRK